MSRRRSIDSAWSELLQRTLRSGWADVKGVGLTHHYPYFNSSSRLWVLLTEDELLFFKDSKAHKALSSVPCSEITDVQPHSSKPHALRIQSKRHKVIKIQFKNSAEFSSWWNEIDKCVRPVLCIGGGDQYDGENSSEGTLTAIRDASEDSSPASSPVIDSPTSAHSDERQYAYIERSRSPKRDSKDSALTGSTFAYSTLTGTTRCSATSLGIFSKANSSTLSFKSFYELKTTQDYVDDYLEEFFKLDDIKEESDLSSTEGEIPERARSPSPLDPEVIFEDERAYIPQSDPSSDSRKEDDCKIHDLTGKVTKLFEAPSAHGGFSDVWKGRLKSGCGRPNFVAIKVIRSFVVEEKKLAKVRKRLDQELDIWRRLKHPNIVPLLGTVRDFGRFLSMISPWVANGTASKYFEKLDLRMSVNARLKLLYEVASGLEYLHSFYPPIVHGDLKASNVLVSDAGRAMLTDFGISRVIEEATGDSHSASSFNGAGSVRWLAFELISGYGTDVDGQSDDYVEVSTMTDVWAFGSTALEVLTGKLPYFHRKSDVHVLHEIMRRRKPLQNDDFSVFPSVPEKLRTFLNTCWHEVPKERPSITEAKDIIQNILREQRRLGVVLDPEK